MTNKLKALQRTVEYLQDIKGAAQDDSAEEAATPAVPYAPFGVGNKMGGSASRAALT